MLGDAERCDCPSPRLSSTVSRRQTVGTRTNHPCSATTHPHLQLMHVSSSFPTQLLLPPSFLASASRPVACPPILHISRTLRVIIHHTPVFDDQAPTQLGTAMPSFPPDALSCHGHVLSCRHLHVSFRVVVDCLEQPDHDQRQSAMPATRALHVEQPADEGRNPLRLLNGIFTGNKNDAKSRSSGSSRQARRNRRMAPCQRP